MRRLIIALVCALAAACAPQQGREDGVYTLRYASPYLPAHPFSRADIIWIEHVERVSEGRIRIRPFWGGALLSADNSVHELRHGVADIALITPIYMRAGMHAVKMQAGFYGGVRAIPDQVTVYRCLARAFPVLDRELDGVVTLAVQGGNLPNVLTRERPVRTLDDLRGLRLRAPSELVPVLRSLGVDVVAMPMGDVYSAISKGVLDGVVAPPDTLRSLHFTEVTRYLNRLEIARGAYPARAISRQAFDRLPADLQRVLVEAAPVWERALSEELVRAEAAGLEAGAAENIEVVELAAGEQARFDRLYAETSLQHSADLTRYGIDGPAMFRRAQAVIAAGAPESCAGSPS